MALLYNNDGTVSDIQVNGMIFGKVSSSLVIPPSIQQSLQASASWAIYQNAINAGSSSKQAYELAYPSGSANRNGRL